MIRSSRPLPRIPDHYDRYVYTRWYVSQFWVLVGPSSNRMEMHSEKTHVELRCRWTYLLVGALNSACGASERHSSLLCKKELYVWWDSWAWPNSMLGDVWRRVRLDLLRFVDDLLTTRSTGEDCAPHLANEHGARLQDRKCGQGSLFAQNSGPGNPHLKPREDAGYGCSTAVCAAFL